MEIKFVVPKMDEMFGVLEFAGVGETKTRRGNNGNRVAVSRTYNLYSNVQTTDDISVVLPSSAGVKNFEPDARVILVNPRIEAVGKKIGNYAFANYFLHADDMMLV